VIVAPAAGDAMAAGMPPVARAAKSYLAHGLASGRFMRSVELLPPKGHGTETMLEWARQLRIRGVDVVHVPEGASGPRMSALALAVLIQQHTGLETALHYSCRDRNLLGMQSDLLGAHAMGLRNLVVVTGEVPPAGDYPDTSAVFDVDSIGLVNVVARLNRGLDIGGQTIGNPTAFHVGVMVNPAADDLEREVSRFEYKVDAGAEFALVRPVFDVATFERLHARIGGRVPLVLCLLPFATALDAEFFANEVPGMHVPAAVVERMRAAATPEAASAAGVAIAGELGRALKGAIQGVHVMAADGQVERALAVVEALA
jgi:homocysteine S-methyltransferase